MENKEIQDEEEKGEKIQIEDNVLYVGSKGFEGLIYSRDYPFCMNCNKKIEGSPIRIWKESEDVKIKSRNEDNEEIEKKVYEFHFCIECAKELGLINKLINGES